MLKKTTLLFALVVINVKLATAQSLSIGPMIGVNVSKIDAAPNTKGLVGVALGGFANYSVNEHVGVGAKILYSQLGSAYTFNDDINRLHYLQLPVTGIYYFGDAGNQFRPKLFAGLYVGSLLRANYRSGDEVLNGDGQKTYNNIDFGGLAGLGFNYRIKSRTWLNVDAGFSRGFTDIARAVENDYRNIGFSLNVGVSFPVSVK